MITFDNFFISTSCVFKGCKEPNRKPDYISYNRYDEISSQYWYGENTKGEYVIRKSGHWVNISTFNSNKISKDCISIASCDWHVKHKEMNIVGILKYSGKCYLKNFKRI